MNRTLQLLILSDGKPGHHNQSLGLAEALARHTPTQFRSIALPDYPRGIKVFKALQKAIQGPRPDWIIATGHGTHLCAIVLSRWLRARSIILMKPSLPTALFDACLIPSHDLINRTLQANVIPTTGALNRITHSREKEAMGLIMVGGDSKEFSLEEEDLRRAISAVIQSQKLDWHITDSRRTADGFLSSLHDLPATLHPHQNTGSEWLPRQLTRASVAWVTRDSVSMIYEALSSGARVGLLPMKPRKPHSKISEAVDQLCAQGYLTTFKDLQQTGRLLQSPPLAEADRCAEILLHQLSSTAS